MAENTVSTVVPAETAVKVGQASRPIQLAFAALLGLVVVGVSGFAATAAVHNATHDYRHSMGFPCH